MQCSPQHTDSAIPAQSIAKPMPSRRSIDRVDPLRTPTLWYPLRLTRPISYLATGRNHPASRRYADWAGEATQERRPANSTTWSRLRPMKPPWLVRDTPPAKATVQYDMNRLQDNRTGMPATWRMPFTRNRSALQRRGKTAWQQRSLEAFVREFNTKRRIVR